MLIISNHAQTVMKIPKNAIIRVNLAWVKNEAELLNILRKTKNKIFVDMPNNRKKPPNPQLNINITEIIKHIDYCKNVKYFAWSNMEEKLPLKILRRWIRKDIIIVPKIETKKGVLNVVKICKGITNMIMLDKEDLYADCPAEYEALVDKCRKTCYNSGIKVLELQGVIFSEEKWKVGRRE